MYVFRGVFNIIYMSRTMGCQLVFFLFGVLFFLNGVSWSWLAVDYPEAHKGEERI